MVTKNSYSQNYYLRDNTELLWVAEEGSTLDRLYIETDASSLYIENLTLFCLSLMGKPRA